MPLPAPAFCTQLSGLQALAHQVLIQHRILREEDDLLAPPFCVWGMPRNNEGKKSGRAKANESVRLRRDMDQQIAPALHFMGAPEMGLRSAGISLGQPEAEVNARDARWIYDRMAVIRDRGHVVYGSQWAVMAFARPDGVSTNTMQRLFEHLMDMVAFKPESELKAILRGEQPAIVHYESKAVFREITGDQLDDDSVLWNLASHPDFLVMTANSKGALNQRTLAKFQVVEAISAADHWTGQQIQPGTAQGIAIQLSRVAVAMAVGQATRFAEVNFGPGYLGLGLGDVPQELAALRIWFWARIIKKLPEYERRLARHLLLSPGGDHGYRYLLTPTYAAEVLGCRVSDSRMHRHRVVKTLQDVAASLLSIVPELTNGIEFHLPGIRLHLEKSLQSILGPRTAEQVPEPGYRSLFDEEPDEKNIETWQDTATEAEAGLEATREVCLKKTEHVPRPFSERLKYSELPNEHLPERLKKTEVVSNLDESLISKEKAAITAFSDIEYSTESTSTEYLFCSALNSSKSSNGTDGAGPEGNKTGSRSILPRGLCTETEQNRIQALNRDDRFSYWLMGDRDLPWSDALLEEFSTWLLPSQMRLLPGLCVWTPEGAWAIFQTIKQENLKFRKEAVFWNALRSRSKGESFVLKAGRPLRDAGWREEPEDYTPKEAPARSEARQSLKYQRLPLSAEGLERRAEILRTCEEERREKERQVLACRQKGQEEIEFEMAQTAPGASALALWQRIRSECESALPSSVFRNWIAPLRPVGFDGRLLTLHSGEPKAKAWIEEQLTEDLFEILENTGLTEIRLNFL